MPHRSRDGRWVSSSLLRGFVPLARLLCEACRVSSSSLRSHFSPVTTAVSALASVWESVRVCVVKAGGLEPTSDCKKSVSVRVCVGGGKWRVLTYFCITSLPWYSKEVVCLRSALSVHQLMKASVAEMFWNSSVHLLCQPTRKLVHLPPLIWYQYVRSSESLRYHWSALTWVCPSALVSVVYRHSCGAYFSVRVIVSRSTYCVCEFKRCKAYVCTRESNGVPVTYVRTYTQAIHKYKVWICACVCSYNFLIHSIM